MYFQKPKSNLQHTLLMQEPLRNGGGKYILVTDKHGRLVQQVKRSRQSTSLNGIMRLKQFLIVIGQHLVLLI